MVRVLVEVVELVREVREMRREEADGRGDLGGGLGVVTALVGAGLAVGMGHLGLVVWGRWGGRQRGGGGRDEAEVAVVSVGRTEEAAVAVRLGEVDVERGEAERVATVPLPELVVVGEGEARRVESSLRRFLPSQL